MAYEQAVYLTGDHELVEEFGLLCYQAGYRVSGTVNPEPGRRKLPVFFKKSTLVPRSAAVAMELTNVRQDLKRKNLKFLDGAMPKGALLLSSSVTVAAHDQASWIARPDRLIGIGALPTFAARSLVEMAPTPQTSAAALGQSREFFARLKKEIAVIQDRVGMVLPRMVCMVINEACFAAGESVASPADIDTAMKLGTNYPFGPLEWASAIGFQQVSAVLEALHRDLGEERYRIAPLLRHFASGNRWWET
jgi:3-hydroxybutyryl-CoA dehydrogenase